MRRSGRNGSGITLSDGEPFCQAAPLARVARAAKETRPRRMGLHRLHVWEARGRGRSSHAGAPRAVDVLVDGPYIEAQKSLDLPFRGSANQRVLALEGGRPVRELYWD